MGFNAGKQSANYKENQVIVNKKRKLSDAFDYNLVPMKKRSRNEDVTNKRIQPKYCYDEKTSCVIPSLNFLNNTKKQENLNLAKFIELYFDVHPSLSTKDMIQAYYMHIKFNSSNYGAFIKLCDELETPESVMYVHHLSNKLKPRDNSVMLKFCEKCNTPGHLKYNCVSTSDNKDTK